MKKTPLLFLILLLITPFSLNSTETRISALGSEENILIDDINIYNYPSCLERFVERGIIEYGFYPYSDSFAYFSFLKELGRFGNIGLIFNKTDVPVFPTTSYETLIAQPDAVINICYSIKIKETFSIGISGGYGIAAANDDEEGTTNDVTNESSVSSGRLSISYSIGESEHFLEIAGGTNIYKFTYKQGDNFTFENNNKMSTVFSGRFFYNLNDYVSLIPFFEYSITDLSSKEAAASITTEINRITTFTKAGIGLNLVPFDENRVILGVLYNSRVSEKSNAAYDTTITDNRMPELVGGIESKLRSWLIVRAGIKKSFLIHKIESENGIKSIFTDKNAPFDLNAGLGLRFGSLEIDAVIHEDLPFTYGYFTSGKENPIFTKVSATYLF